MSKLETFLKELLEKQSEIASYERKLPDWRTEKRIILYTEVTDDIWQLLMKDKYFKRSVDGVYPGIGPNIGGIAVRGGYFVDKGYPNMQGYGVTRGSNFAVHYQTYIKEKPQWRK